MGAPAHWFEFFVKTWIVRQPMSTPRSTARGKPPALLT